MAMHLIIDGYNLIRQSPDLLAQEHQGLHLGREALLDKLTAYRRLKKHAITVVFDGWEAGDSMANRDHFQGILVIFSRRGEKADEVIKRLADQEQHRALVVSSDREIMDYVEHRGAAAMSAEEFNFRLELAVSGGDATEFEEDRPVRSTRKKGPAHRASKKNRRWRQRAKKI